MQAMLEEEWSTHFEDPLEEFTRQIREKLQANYRTFIRQYAWRALIAMRRPTFS